jgi:hypothetical protein
MDKILERYERYSYAEKALISAESESEVRYDRLENLWGILFVRVRLIAHTSIYLEIYFIFFEYQNTISFIETV